MVDLITKIDPIAGFILEVLVGVNETKRDLDKARETIAVAGLRQKTLRR